MLSIHDSRWSTEFDALKSMFSEHLGALISSVEHVGSTAVPDLLAKPILDIDLVMPDYSVFPDIVVRLGRLGYTHNGDQGIYQREAFKPNGIVAPNIPRSGGWMHHHLYVCPAFGAELQRHLRFRDALRQNADLRREYETIKKSIADRSDGDRRKYAELKERECVEFFERVFSRAGRRLSGEVCR